ncbi:hypothetical protein OE88DRAFT_1648906 [Heliocybe sulcata]|uniref:Uncharacterized protein n=1 Tax=Heliocybe sulcata TaxID=5364 RepID=A0A5C3MPR8_9AGAM|nr:hypothetical protein OE88DRAFT_1648906 [Heliocybe sulcata]
MNRLGSSPSRRALGIGAGLSKSEAELDAAMQVFELLVPPISENQQKIRQGAHMQPGGEGAAVTDHDSGPAAARAFSALAQRVVWHVREYQWLFGRLGTTWTGSRDRQKTCNAVWRKTPVYLVRRIVYGKLLKTDDMPFVGGTFTEVRHGMLLGTEKAVRDATSSDEAKRVNLSLVMPVVGMLRR